MAQGVACSRAPRALVQEQERRRAAVQLLAVVPGQLVGRPLAAAYSQDVPDAHGGEDVAAGRRRGAQSRHSAGFRRADGQAGGREVPPRRALERPGAGVRAKGGVKAPGVTADEVTDGNVHAP